MIRRAVLLGLLTLVSTGCYQVTVNTGAAHAPNRIERPWQMSFAAGLVPPPEIDTRTDCPDGVAQVRTQRSFLNLLAAGITSNIISPMEVEVICAAGPVQR